MATGENHLCLVWNYCGHFWKLKDRNNSNINGNGVNILNQAGVSVGRGKKSQDCNHNHAIQILLLFLCAHGEAGKSVIGWYYVMGISRYDFRIHIG